MTVYANENDLKALSEFPAVTAKTAPRLGVYMARAHTIASTYGPFQEAASLSAADAVTFAAEMRIALVLIAERLVLAQPATGAQAQGKTSEKILDYSYSRAPGGGESGQAVANEIVSNEVLAIFKKWRAEEDDYITPHRTQVFDNLDVVLTGTNELVHVFVEENDIDFTPGLNTDEFTQG